VSAVPQGETRDEELLADLFDTLLQDILEGRTPDVATLLPDRPDLRDRVQEAWHLACSVAGRRVPSRPVLGGYEILRELGHGGMGTVYLARHEQLARDVAIKVLPQSLAMSPRAKERFLEEARALAQLRHEHVVPIHRIIDHEEMLAFEMEYVAGGSLQSLILALQQHDKPFALESLQKALGCDVGPGVRSSVEWFVRVGIKMARALGVVHRHGLIHRDVKPSNILLRKDGTPVLADFGLALQGELDSTRTKFAGTPVYAAPERLRGGDGRVDARTDVYSLGVTLYEAFTSSPPFRGSSTDEVLRRIESGNAPPLRDRAPHVSADLSTIIAKAIEPDPRRRYATADEFADDLERLLNLQPILARPAGPLRRLSKFLARNRKAVFAATAGAALVALAAWPIAAHADARQAARARSTAARTAARSALLQPETLPTSWSAQPVGERLLEQSNTVAARGRAFRDALAHYRSALEATPDDARLRLEHGVVDAVDRLLGGGADAAAVFAALPPVCRQLVANAREHRRLTDDLGDGLARANDDDRFASGLFAFLWGDHALCANCWTGLGPDWREDALVDACSALRLAAAGPADRAYPRLFHAVRALPEAKALAFALADAALAAGDLPLARQWIQALPRGAAPTDDVGLRLLEADLAAAEGDTQGAARSYREISIDDASNPAPRLRLAMLALRVGERAAGERQLDYVLSRWPDLAFARQQLARMALLDRDTTRYLQHARHAVGQLRRQATPALGDSLGILRLGGLNGLLGELASAAVVDGATARTEDVVPLRAWLRPATVVGIEQALRAFALYDDASNRLASHDRRPIGVALRSTWLVLLQTPQALLRLPAAAQVALVAGIPCLLGRATDQLTLELLPYERALGKRLHRVQDRRLFRGPASDDVVYGSQLLVVGDLDGDTLDELLVAAPPSPQAPGTGFVEVRNLHDGALLRTWLHDDEHAMFGRAVASLGDIDGDLCADVAIGIPLASHEPTARAAVELWSGRTGERIWRVEEDGASFGSALARLGDVNGDGVPDLVVGMSPGRLHADAHGLAFVCSGKDGDVLHVLASQRGGTWFGGSCANAGDVNGDGIDDVVVGGNYGDAPGLVVVFDGATGERLTTLVDSDSNARFGETVLGCGDLDDDGRAEILVTAPGRAGPNQSGRVLVFSSRTGRTLYELSGERPGDGFGASVQLLPHWQRNSGPAIAVATRGGGALGTGWLRVFDLKSTTPVQTFTANAPLTRFAIALADLGDRDRDGLRDLGVVSFLPDGMTEVWALSWADATPRPEAQAPK